MVEECEGGEESHLGVASSSSLSSLGLLTTYSPLISASRSSSLYCTLLQASLLLYLGHL